MDDFQTGLPNDEELACRAQAGCAASFDELVRRLQVPVVHFLRHRVAAADVDDLAQETFVRAYENLARYRCTWPFKTWLMTIARRLSINQHRRARPDQLGDSELASLPAETPGPVQVAMAKEERRLLWSVAADVLSEAQWTALWLHYVEELPVLQVARVLGRSRVAVKGLMFRARQKLMPMMRTLDVDRVPVGKAPPADGLSDEIATSAEASHV